MCESMCIHVCVYLRVCVFMCERVGVYLNVCVYFGIHMCT